MTKILITGSNSFVGKNYINNSNYKSIDELSLFELKPEEIDFSSYDIVIHLVAIVHQSKRIHENQYYKVNRDLCLNVAEYAKKSRCKAVYFSKYC